MENKQICPENLLVGIMSTMALKQKQEVVKKPF